MRKPIQLTLIRKPGCHLCDEADLVIQAVLAQFRQTEPEAEVALVEKDILEDEELYKRYWEEIPVLLINGQVHNYWKIDPERLESALKDLA
jgi:glutaredoxin